MELEALVEVNSATKIAKNKAQVVQKPVSELSYEQQFFNKTGKDFNTFYEKYYKKLVWIVQQMNINHIDAEDITNQAFMQALKKIEMYNPQYHFSTWLFDIGKKMAYQYKKDEKKREICVDTSTDGGDEDDANYDPVQRYLKSKMDSVQDDCDTQYMTSLKYNETLREISKLDPKYKRIIELSDIEGKTYNEICDILGSELGSTPEHRLQTVKNRLHHGRLRIENNVKEKFKLIETNY
jgi:RNA polymerase sigma factor (sigma-70 family)